MTQAARLPRRLASAAYDALLVTALVFIANVALLPLVTPAQPHRALVVPDVATRALLACALFAIAAVYFVWSWTGGRRTLAMKTWHLRLVDRDGRALSYRVAFIRYLAAWIGPALALVAYLLLRAERLGGVAVVLLPLNYYAALFDPDKQFLHDRIARTRIVVDDPVDVLTPPGERSKRGAA